MCAHPTLFVCAVLALAHAARAGLLTERGRYLYSQLWDSDGCWSQGGNIVSVPSVCCSADNSKSSICTLSGGQFRKCCAYPTDSSSIEERQRKSGWPKPLAFFVQHSIEQYLCFAIAGRCFGQAMPTIDAQTLAVGFSWRLYHSSGFHRRTSEPALRKRREAIDWLWQGFPTMVFHDSPTEQNYAVFSFACSEGGSAGGGFHCPLTLPLAIFMFQKSGSSSTTKWIGSLCRVHQDSPWNLTDAWAELGRRWPHGDETIENIGLAARGVAKHLGENADLEGLTLAQEWQFFQGTAMSAVIDTEESVARKYVQQLVPRDATTVSHPYSLWQWGLPCCRFGTSRLHVFFVRHPFYRWFSKFMHDGGGSPADFAHNMRTRFAAGWSLQLWEVRRLLDIGEEVVNQRSLFASRGALLVHLETVQDDLQHVQSCLCLVYGACGDLPPFPMVNVGANKTAHQKIRMFWTRELVNLYLAHGGVEDMKFLGYSTNLGFHRPSETFRMCG